MHTRKKNYKVIQNYTLQISTLSFCTEHVTNLESFKVEKLFCWLPIISNVLLLCVWSEQFSKWQAARSNGGICGHGWTFTPIQLHLFERLFLNWPRKWPCSRRRTRPMHPLVVWANTHTLWTKKKSDVFAHMIILRTKAKYNVSCSLDASSSVVNASWILPRVKKPFWQLPYFWSVTSDGWFAMLWPKKPNCSAVG